MGKYQFSCSAMPVLHGYELNALEPDSDGYYEVTVGAIGSLTRARVQYDPDSMIRAMSDPKSRFRICLEDANLFGEYGHPDCNNATPDEIKRLLKLDDQKTSHQFGKIWVAENPLMVEGQPIYPIKAKVKPCGPYGPVLEKMLRDPTINNAFSNFECRWLAIYV